VPASAECVVACNSAWTACPRGHSGSHDADEMRWWLTLLWQLVLGKLMQPEPPPLGG
jgi:hypothetical protein